MSKISDILYQHLISNIFPVVGLSDRFKQGEKRKSPFLSKQGDKCNKL
jgi:hypothetical protein